MVSFVHAVADRPVACEYRAHLRNLTLRTVGWVLTVGSMTNGVSAPLEHPMRGFPGPYVGETLRIGRGPTASISLYTVEALHNRAGGAKPSLSLRSRTVRPR